MRAGCKKNIKKQDIVSFDSKTKYSITKVDGLNLIKGAPEVLLKNCNRWKFMFSDGVLER